MTSKLFLVGAMAAATITANAQSAQTTQENCRCEDSFEWLRSTFETNDAGFGYIVERKGRAAYDLHNTMTLEKARAAQSSAECTVLLGEWLTFFRRGHIGIRLLKADAPAPAAQNPAAEMWTGDIAAFEKEMAAGKDTGYEGVWKHTAGFYSMGIKAEGDGYIGFIIESSSESMKPGQVMVKMFRDNEKWRTTYYMNGVISLIADGQLELIGKKHLSYGGQTMIRVSPELPSDPEMESYIKAISTQTPYIEQLNPTTLYIRIPSFNPGQKAAIDKIIADNRDKLLSTENLIIDVRGNGGGFSTSYGEIMPLLYTNPIRMPGFAFYATPLNIAKTEELLGMEEIDEDTRGQIAALVGKMKTHQGEFVLSGDNDVEIETFDTVYEFPRNVGIIVDRRCGSATEMFLMAAKQSRKVKLFGVTTLGSHDISDVRPVDSPDGRYRLSYATSRSANISGMPIDGIGLQPDYYLDATIQSHKWVEFVSDILNR
jgi:hypothetical protein